MPGRIRLVDVAAACGLSKAAVVQALNRPPETCELRPATRQRIRAQAERMGYRPDWRARALAGGRTGTIGLLYAGHYPPLWGYSALVLAHLARHLADRGRGLLLLRCWERATWRELIEERRIDGALVMDATPDGLLDATPLPVPLVLINLATPLAIPQVLPDDRGGALLAVRRLTALGHRRIAHLTSAADSGHFSALARREGYLAGMAEAGLPPRIADRAEDLFPREQQPSAVLAYDDRLALTAAQLARQRGLRIPQDLAVVGTNDSPEAGAATPPLASVVLPTESLAAASVDLLLGLIDGAPSPTAPLLLPESLAERSSLGPPGPGSEPQGR